MSETAVEQRLREISAKIDTGREDTELSLALYPHWPESIRVGALNRADDMRADRDAIDAGREAIQLLRSWTEDGTPWDEYDECAFCGERWKNPRVHGKDCAWTAAIALLARCEGE